MSEGIPTSTATEDKPHTPPALSDPAHEAKQQVEADTTSRQAATTASVGEKDSSTDASVGGSPSIDRLESTSEPQDE